MRTIHSHDTNECNKMIRITADDRDADNGNASHVYWLDRPTNKAPVEGGEAVVRTVIAFQHGPIQENGINGLTNEALLAVVIDRMEGFQAGPYACRENAIALTKMQEAAHWLEHRTAARTRRGVEGTSDV